MRPTLTRRTVTGFKDDPAGAEAALATWGYDGVASGMDLEHTKIKHSSMKKRLAPMLVRVLRRMICSLTLLAAFLLVLFTTDGRAEDYALAYGIELNGMRDTGAMNQCNIEQPCEIRNDRLDLPITMTVHGGVTWLADIRIGYRGTCCLFDGGEDSYIRDVGNTDLIRIPIYEGKRRLQNEFVQNKSVGTLWLAFSKFSR